MTKAEYRRTKQWKDIRKKVIAANKKKYNSNLPIDEFDHLPIRGKIVIHHKDADCIIYHYDTDDIEAFAVLSTLSHKICTRYEKITTEVTWVKIKGSLRSILDKLIIKQRN